MHLLTGVPWIVLAVGVAGIAAVNPIDARKRMEIFIVGIMDLVDVVDTNSLIALELPPPTLDYFTREILASTTAKTRN